MDLSQLVQLKPLLERVFEVVFVSSEPFSSSVWYSGHSTTQVEDHSLPCLSPEVYGNPGGRDYGTPDTPLADSQK